MPPSSVTGFVPSTVSTGRVVSATSMVTSAVAPLPSPSCASHRTVVLPTAKVPPDSGLQVTATAPSKPSTALAEYVTTAPAPLVASTTAGAAIVMTGGVPSSSAASSGLVPPAISIPSPTPPPSVSAATGL